MSEFKGTKEKWIKDNNQIDIGDKYVCIILNRDLNPKFKDEELRYNIQLVSKAPEMLEMLEHISDLVKYFDEWKLEKQKIEKIIKEATEL